ncbi:D-glycerate dehydrogenase [Halanaerobiaceae bacterium Z-7014]|uniref:D-glycerate dehydrogenase n=1 Tax=Halonatronomonas betaini TaxID=2778430 RepID=A0A931AQQ2_9FIRM|nr:D-glycerate dehydrogenase [Halonatronomonas betaini]
MQRIISQKSYRRDSLSKPEVYVSRVIPETGLNILEEKCDVTVNEEDKQLSKSELIDNLKGKDGALVMLSDEIDRELIEACPDLKAVSNLAVGYNNIDVQAAKEAGIIATNVPGVLTEATAELTWALLMAVARRVVEADKFLRAGKFKSWGPKLLMGNDIYGKKLGIIGFGDIGQAVARKAAGFNMEIFYNKRNRLSIPAEKRLGVEYKKLPQLLAESDYITVNAPLNSDTYHLIGTEELQIMKETAYIINTGRGPIIDEKALVKALRENVIAGAGLDVFENEPDVEPGLLELDNVVLTPHIGSASKEARYELAEKAASDLVAALTGGEVENPVT